MRAPTQAGGLTTRIDQLLQERQQHTEAVEKIDATIAEIERLLGSAGSGPRRRGRPPGRPRAVPVSVGVRAGRKRKRGRFATTGEESIISFVRANRNPTTQDVKRHWASEGRGGTADNALSKLVRDRKLKRIALEDQRGSRYSL
jgi:hypothetical protein